MNLHAVCRLALLAIIALSVVGCEGGAVIVVNRPPHGSGCPGDMEAIYVDDEATIAEIGAARSLSFNSDRTIHLARIASRSNLGPSAQVYLVDSTFDLINFESEKINVLKILIDNPTFCSQAKSQILARLDDLSFNSNRSSILAALDRRGPAIDYTNEPVYEEAVVIEVPGIAEPVAPESE